MGNAAKRQAQSLTLLDLPDCRYLDERGRCRIWVSGTCAGDGCAFQQAAGREQTGRQTRWAARLCALPPAQQQEIAKKYYHGSMPWKHPGEE